MIPHFVSTKFNPLRVLLYQLRVAFTFIILSSFIIFWFFGVFLASMVLTTGITGLLYNEQDLLLYYPNDPPDSRLFVLQPSSYKLAYENINLKTKDGKTIHMFLILQATGSKHKPTMIFFHGNAGNMGQRLANAFGFYHKLNINIVLLEYRGYGMSKGSPSEQDLYIDAQSSLEYILQRNDIDHKKIIVFGRSLGGAVAIHIASRPEYRDRIWALIVENTFTSVPDMARILLKFQCTAWIPTFCYKNKFFSLSKMRSVRCPTLVVCGTQDTIVPLSMGRTLAEHCGAAVRRLVVLPGDHNDTWTCPEYYPELGRFLATVPPLQPARPLRNPTRCLIKVSGDTSTTSDWPSDFDNVFKDCL